MIDDFRLTIYEAVSIMEIIRKSTKHGWFIQPHC